MKILNISREVSFSLVTNENMIPKNGRDLRIMEIINYGGFNPRSS